MGPYCTLVLARMGADVVKVEAPDGDIVRFIGGGRNPGMGPIFLATNHGKRSVALDLKQPEGRAVLLRLLADADVFVTNMGRDGWLGTLRHLLSSTNKKQRMGHLVRPRYYVSRTVTLER